MRGGLYLGGALPDCSGWPAFCASEKNSVYCNSWAEKRISEKFCSALPLTKSLADTRVKAVAAASPDFSMLLSRESLRYFYPPLLAGDSAQGKRWFAQSSRGSCPPFPVCTENRRHRKSR